METIWSLLVMVGFGVILIFVLGILIQKSMQRDHKERERAEGESDSSDDSKN